MEVTHLKDSAEMNSALESHLNASIFRSPKGHSEGDADTSVSTTTSSSDGQNTSENILNKTKDSSEEPTAKKQKLDNDEKEQKLTDKGDDDQMEDSQNQEKTKKEKQEENRQKMQVLVSNFSEDQLDRYEMFRRATFPRASVKRLMQSITGTVITQNIVIAMAGITKVFVGEVMEEAMDVMEHQGESGPVQPKHLREAVRKLRARDAIPTTKYKKKMFPR